jgi:hypothetical protein
MLETILETLTLDKLVHPVNVFAPILATLVGISKLVT